MHLSHATHVADHDLLAGLSIKARTVSSSSSSSSSKALAAVRMHAASRLVGTRVVGVEVVREVAAGACAWRSGVSAAEAASEASTEASCTSEAAKSTSETAAIGTWAREASVAVLQMLLDYK